MMNWGRKYFFFLDQLKVFCGLVFFMISNPLGEIRTNPLELREKKENFILKLRQIKPVSCANKCIQRIFIWIGDYLLELYHN
jgi:hypothetical protein